jgi:hypothetical protein
MASLLTPFTLKGITLKNRIAGTFGAALVPLSQSVLLDINPPERQGSAMALCGQAMLVTQDPPRSFVQVGFRPSARDGSGKPPLAVATVPAPSGRA